MEITYQKFNDILYKFFAGLACLGLGMFAMDLILLANHHNLFMFRTELKGYDNILGLLPEIFLGVVSWRLAKFYRKQSEALKWR